MKSSKLLAALTASALLISPTFAAETAISPLPAGKPAGVKAAAMHAPLWVWIAGVGFVALGVGLAVASGNKNTVTSATTTGTGP